MFAAAALNGKMAPRGPANLATEVLGVANF